MRCHALHIIGSLVFPAIFGLRCVKRGGYLIGNASNCGSAETFSRQCFDSLDQNRTDHFDRRGAANWPGDVNRLHV